VFSVTRPGKITPVAVIVLIGAVFLLICGAFALTTPKESRFISSMFLLIAAWGLATGVGVLWLQRWARLSVLLFVGLTGYLVASLAPLLMFFHMPTRPGVPNLTDGARTIIFFLSVLLVGTCLWCAYVLSTRASRESFGVSATLRPFSITVIGWYLLMSGIFGMVAVAAYRRSPRMSFGFVFTGWSATTVTLFYAVVELYIGIGLLRRREQIRRLAIYYYLFQFFDVIVFYFRPDREAAVKTYYNARALFRAASATSLPVDALSQYLRLVSIEWCLFTLIALWFLAARKKEFATILEFPQRSAD
jgi:hypothetical protein